MSGDDVLEVAREQTAARPENPISCRWKAGLVSMEMLQDGILTIGAVMGSAPVAGR
ncbi:MAG: hypothetical protein KIT18_03695 [Burkholderiales bacterium]|nr:hypothetical protein [Burkholderiales bacterium]